jgi:hypothetical protein
MEIPFSATKILTLRELGEAFDWKSFNAFDDTVLVLRTDEGNSVASSLLIREVLGLTCAEEKDFIVSMQYL